MRGVAAGFDGEMPQREVRRAVGPAHHQPHGHAHHAVHFHRLARHVISAANQHGVL
jgi:hypothetical protein